MKEKKNKAYTITSIITFTIIAIFNSCVSYNAKKQQPENIPNLVPTFSEEQVWEQNQDEEIEEDLLEEKEEIPEYHK